MFPTGGVSFLLLLLPVPQLPSCAPGLSPHPSSCGSFLQCAGDELHTINCPPGLLFNTATVQCDWPDNVDCSSSASSTTASPGSSQPSSTTSPPQSSTTSKATTTTRKPTTTTTEGTNTKNPPAQGEEVLTCAGRDTSEPISEEVKKLRETTCSLDNSQVERVVPGRLDNPPNVRVLESVLSSKLFDSFFPRAHSAYTYTNLLRAFAKFPAVCTTPELCRKILANMFAHFQQETAGLVYLREINKSNYCATWSNWVTAAYPCSPGKQYYGRGAKQLSWNYNYGAFSRAMYGDSSVLLQDPERVADTWLNFASALWFFVTPQPPKPSMLSLVDGSWQPNADDQARGLKPGLGATTMAINGAIECGQSPGNSRASLNRQKAYKRFAKELGISIAGEKLDCRDMQSFSAQGSANPAIYWAPEQGCRLVRWQTAYSALVEGDHHLCVSSITRAADFTPASPFLVALLPYTSWIFV